MTDDTRERAAGSRIRREPSPRLGEGCGNPADLPGSELQRSGELPCRVFEALAEHVAVVDGEGWILLVNRSWRDFAEGNGAGEVPSVAPGANYLEVCRRSAAAGDASAAAALAGIQSVLAGATARFSHEYPCHSRVEQRWFLMTVVPLDPAGKGGAVISHLNVTDRKRMEDALRHTEEALYVQRERMPIGWMVVDERGVVSRINPTAERIFGYSEAELAGKHVSILVPEPARRHVEGIMARLAQGDMGAHSVNENLTRDGRTIFCEWTNTPLRDAGGAFRGFVSMFQDVTERKLAEKALRESNMRLALAMEGTRMGMFEWNIATGETLWTEQQERLLGYPAEDRCPNDPGEGDSAMRYRKYRYQDWASRVHPGDLPRVEAALRRCIAERLPMEVEYRIIWPDGSQHWLATRGALVTEPTSGSPRMVGMIMDITESKAAEEQLRRAAAGLRGANEELKKFNRAMVGRELRMIELKREVNELCAKLGLQRRYGLEFEDAGR